MLQREAVFWVALEEESELTNLEHHLAADLRNMIPN